MKSEINELMVLCDIERHDDSQVLQFKAKMVAELLELGRDFCGEGRVVNHENLTNLGSPSYCSNQN